MNKNNGKSGKVKPLYLQVDWVPVLLRRPNSYKSHNINWWKAHTVTCHD